MLRADADACVVYEPSHTRLLLASSAALLGVAATVHHLGSPGLALRTCAMAMASLNYWRAPGRGWRRDLDVVLGVGLVVPNAIVALWLEGAPNVVGWAAFVLACYCFHRSWHDSAVVGDKRWALWHVGAHACMAVAALALAIGGAEAVATAVWPPRNILGLAALASVGLSGLLRLRLARETCRTRSREDVQ